jgi:hypothetical protein
MSVILPRILLASEGGGGAGHSARLARIAQELNRRGAICVGALSPRMNPGGLEAQAESLTRTQVIIQPPDSRWPRYDAAPGGRDSISYTYVLWQMAAWNLPGVQQRLRNWMAILDRVKPDLIITDTAPFAAWAASGRIPVCVTGTGYAVPTLCDGWLSPDGHAPSPQELGEQKRLKAVFANAAAKIPSLKATSPFTAMCGDIPSPASLAEFDPRNAVRDGARVPPVLAQLPVPPAEVTRHKMRRIFIYVSDEAEHLPAIIASLTRLRMQADLYWRGPLNKIAIAVDCPLVTIRAAPFTDKEMAEEASLVIHHGGAGFAQMAALAGVPQMILYRFEERWVQACAVHARKAGFALRLDIASQHLDGHLGNLVGNAEMRACALQWAQDAYASMNGQTGQQVIADRVFAHLG